MSENSGTQKNNSDQHNNGGLIAFLFSMVFVFAFFFYLVAIHPGVDLQENVIDPNAPSAEGQAPQFDIGKVAEPWVETPEMLTYGAKLFKTNCAMCHGDQGKGDGPAGVGLNPKPRNMVEGKWTKGDGLTDHFNVVTNGIAGSSMASFKHFKSADRWALVLFVNSISQNKSKQDAKTVADFAKSAQ